MTSPPKGKSIPPGKANAPAARSSEPPEKPSSAPPAAKSVPPGPRSSARSSKSIPPGAAKANPPNGAKSISASGKSVAPNPKSISSGSKSIPAGPKTVPSPAASEPGSEAAHTFGHPAPNTAPAPAAPRRRGWIQVLGGIVLLGLGMLVGALWLAPERGAAPLPAPASKHATRPPLPPPELHGDRILSGNIRDDRGQALESALIRIASLDEPEALPREAQSDAQGTFAIADLPRHSFEIEVTSVGHDGVERVVRPEDNAPLNFVLPRQGELLVALRDVPGSSLADAEVIVTGTGLWPAARCRSDERGECLIGALPGGQYRARARHGMRVGLPSAPITIVPGERGRVELTLEAGMSLRGTVVDRTSQKPLAGARVTALDLTPGLEPIAVNTDGSGAFEIQGLWPAPVHVEVTHDGYAPRGTDVTLPFATALSFELDGAASISGRVVDDDGNGVAGALLSVSSPEGLPALALAPNWGELGVTSGPIPKIPLAADHGFALGALAAETDENGFFRISGLEPGTVVVRASRAGFAPAELQLEDLAPHVQKEEVNVVLHKSGEVRGSIVDARGHPVPGVYVAAFRADAPEQSGMTDEHGEFRLRDLLGELLIRAQPDGSAPLSCSVTVTSGQSARCDLVIGSELFDLPVRVVDEQGFGLTGAVVTLRAPKVKRSYTQVSQRDGRVVLHELPEPPYVLDVQLPGYIDVTDQPINQADTEVRITLGRAAGLSGVVLDASGRPVPRAFVSTDEGEATTEADDTGSFLLEGVAPGPLTLWAAQSEAGEGTSEEIRARPGETLPNVRIVLKGRYTGQGEAAVASTSPKPRAAPSRAAEAPAAEQRTKPSDCTLEQRADKVIVAGVADGGPAARAGLRAGDILDSVDGEGVLSTAHGRGMLRDPPGTIARVRVIRNRQPINLRYRRPSL